MRLVRSILCLIVALSLSGCQTRTAPELREQHVQYLQDNKWVIVNSPDESKVENGACFYTTKTIYLYHPDEGTLVHEVGHAILRHNWYGSLFDTLYEQEGDGRGAEEYMAHAFEDIYLDAGTYSRTHPKTYYVVYNGFFGETAVDHEFLRQATLSYS